MQVVHISVSVSAQWVCTCGVSECVTLHATCAHLYSRMPFLQKSQLQPGITERGPKVSRSLQATGLASCKHTTRSSLQRSQVIVSIGFFSPELYSLNLYFGWLGGKGDICILMLTGDSAEPEGPCSAKDFSKYEPGGRTSLFYRKR